VRKPLLPVRRNLSGFGADCVDVGSKGQRDYVGVEAVDNGARLGSGAAMRSLDGYRFSRFSLPISREGGVRSPCKVRVWDRRRH
jgi:hypothetical protein